MTAATYGQLRFFPREGGRPDTWCIQATPDVVLRIKRILPRVRTEAARVLTIVELARRVLQRHGITPPTAPDAGVDAQLDQAG